MDNSKSTTEGPDSNSDAPGKDAQCKIASDINAKPNRNLSISRSGRHKMKVKRRESVMQDDLFGSSPPAGGATSGCHSSVQSSYNRSGSGPGGSTSCWETERVSSLRLRESRAMSSRPTVV